MSSPISVMAQRVAARAARRARMGQPMAEPTTTDATTRAGGPGPLRVALGGPRAHRDRAAWALEALLARARVHEWVLVDEGEPADLAWGASAEVELPADAAAWSFRWDAEPDQASDPLAFTFWWLARVEELLAPEEAHDEHGRFRFGCSAMARLEEPLSAPVDDLVEPLAARLAAWRRQPGDAEPTYRVVATHDIDLPWRWTRVGRRRALRSVREDLRRRRIGRAARTGAAWLGGLLPGRHDPWDNFRRVQRLERREQARSTSYLLVGRHGPEDGDEELHRRGARYVRRSHGESLAGLVGVHGSYTASEHPERLEGEVEVVADRTGGRRTDHRFHYLRHRPPSAWPMLDRLGMTTDASLGFAEQPGFRAGTAHPYRTWDHAAGRALDLVVIPLALMDASFDERYLDVRDRHERDRLVLEAVDAIGRRGGCASVLVHNDRLCNATDDGWTATYRRLLRHVRATGGEACTAAAAGAAYRALLPERLG